jgi:hypothetical protein
VRGSEDRGRVDVIMTSAWPHILFLSFLKLFSVIVICMTCGPESSGFYYFSEKNKTLTVDPTVRYLIISRNFRKCLNLWKFIENSF